MRSRNVFYPLFILFLLFSPQFAFSQLTVTAGGTAASLAAALAGPGVSISGASLTCSGAANGTFTVSPGTPLGTGSTVWGIGTGIMLSTGIIGSGSGPEGILASTNLSMPGDPALTTLAGASTHDACILQFDVVPQGDTIKFNYIFGSEEYNNSTCGPYNDAFAFFISGPGIAGTQNMALVPGTTIPVTVNSINNGVPGPGYTLAACTIMGAGSPFTGYYADNSGGSFFTMKGFTKKMTAMHSAAPCNTYHLYISIADAGNGLYDSEVFIEGGSLTSNSISGASTLCAGGSATLSTGVAGGTWSSSNATVATVGVTTGLVTGVAGGTATISYTTGPGCYATMVVTVSALTAISGPSTVCVAGTATLTGTPASGTWTSTGSASIGLSSGIVTGGAAGTALISYVAPGGCGATKVMTVNPQPSMSGLTGICIGNSYTVTATPAGGAWSGTGGITVGAAGVVTAVTAGSASITYTGTSGCMAISPLSVFASPVISGPLSVCVAGTATLTGTPAGGTWTNSGSNATIAPSSGIVSGVSVGTVVISYLAGVGCQSAIVMTVNPQPSISGLSQVCAGSSFTASAAPAGGTWSSAGGITVGSVTGIVTGTTAGTAVIGYTDLQGCITNGVVTVNAIPLISGTLDKCVGSSETYTALPGGGTWTSTDVTIGVSTGTVGSIPLGSAVITYTAPTGCMGTATITGEPIPTIISPMTVCQGSSITLTASTGSGIWSGGGGAATISVTGVVTGAAGGISLVTYTSAAGCATSGVVTVLPVTPITGTLGLCNGASAVLSNSTTGGTWSNNDSSVAIVSTSGTWTAIGEDTTSIFYLLPSGCVATVVVTVFPIPAAPIASNINYCQYATPLPLTAIGASLVWYVGDTSTAGSPTAPTPSAAEPGTFLFYVTQTSSEGCTSPSAVITVHIVPETAPQFSVTDTVICAGVYVTFTGSSPGSQDFSTMNWNFGDGSHVDGINPVKHAFGAPGTYDVTGTAIYDVCIGQNVTQEIRVYAAPYVNLGNDTSICAGSNAIVLGDLNGQAGGSVNWLWSTGAHTAAVAITAPGTYYVQTELNGCTAADTILVRPDCYLDIPSAFTPNGDGINDYFFPRSLLSSGLTGFDMSIYNRWGELIFHSMLVDGSGWDGRYNNAPQPEGVYIYSMDATFKDGQHEHHQGNVTLLR